MAEKLKVIVDGDGGGDEMQLNAVLLAHPDEVEVLGETCVFGNTDHDQVFRNTRDFMHLFGRAQGNANIPVYPGEKSPLGAPLPEGDNAHGHDGIGGAHPLMLPSPAPVEKKHAVEFILEQLRTNPPGTVTVSASGPLTNIAKAWMEDPETMKKVKQIVIMGGCTKDLQGWDFGTGAEIVRRGNITVDAEFNFQQAAQDAKTVMESGLPITLIPMNCTQKLSLTEARQKAIESALERYPRASEAIIRMMRAPVALDKGKFHSDPFMHDVHCALYMLHPELYRTVTGNVSVSADSGEKDGRTDFTAAESGVRVAEELTDPDKAFDIYRDSLDHLKGRFPTPGPRPALA